MDPPPGASRTPAKRTIQVSCYTTCFDLDKDYLHLLSKGLSPWCSLYVDVKRALSRVSLLDSFVNEGCSRSAWHRTRFGADAARKSVQGAH